MNKNVNAVILYGSFLLLNLILLSLNQIDLEVFLFVILISSYYMMNIDSFDYKNGRTYIFPIFTLILYVVVTMKVFS